MKLISAVIFLLILSQLAQAQNYPELMVAPRASERIKREAIIESQKNIVYHLPTQISGVITLAAGFLSNADLDKNKDADGIGPKVAMVVGGSWVAISIAMQTAYRPYLMGYSEVKKMPTSTTHEQLAAERIAEEHIEETAAWSRKLKWLSFSTNLLANAYALTSAKTDSTGQGVAIVGGISSFLPLLFSHRSEQVAEDHRSYKKKIFGPITLNTSLLNDPESGKLTPGLMMGATF